jgi:molybdopterin molybdotransferase
MITVEEAEKIIYSQQRDFGSEKIPFTESLNRVLAGDIKADRDLPPYDRVTMDGIAIRYEAIQKGIKSFTIKTIQAAGDTPVNIDKIDECIEIMTGAALPWTTDTVVRYEDIVISDKKAHLQTQNLRKRQNIHFKGSDRKKDEIIVPAHQIITPAIIGTLAAVGSKDVSVKKIPKLAVVSTGDELVNADNKPSPFQIRKSNDYSIEATLKKYSLQPDLLHLPDNAEIIKKEIETYLKNYDVLIFSGGVSMGKFDFLPKVLQELSVQLLFHKVEQRPGKPFWFGSYGTKLIFAFPGNPVSAFLCLHRYFLPWLQTCLCIPPSKIFAALGEDIGFEPPLTYFPQVKLQTSVEGKLIAHPVKGNGSGDFSSLVGANAFMELPADRTFFKKGEVFRAWPFT